MVPPGPTETRGLTRSAAPRDRNSSPAVGRVGFEPDRYKQRDTVERCFQKLKTWRDLATCYDKSPAGYEAGLHLRGSIR